VVQTIEERRAKDRERTAKYRRENPEKVKEIQKRSQDRIRDDPERLSKLRGWQTQYREQNRRALSDGERHRKFGITPEGYSELLKSQNGTCAICKQPETATRLGKVKALAVDHCHQSGAIRGLLCADCNTGIGKLRENTSIFLSAIRYLDYHSRQLNHPTGLADAAQTDG
jgi:hypothetical protein